MGNLCPFFVLAVVVVLCSAELSEREKSSIVFKLRACTTELEVARVVRDSAQAKLAEGTERLTELEAEIHTLRQTVSAAEDATAAVEDQRRVLQMKLDSCVESRKEELLDERKAEERIASLAHTNEVARTELSAAREELALLRGKLRDSGEEILSLQRDNDAAANEIEALRKQIRSLEQGKSRAWQAEAEEALQRRNPHGDHGESTLSWEHDHHSEEENALREKRLEEAYATERSKRSSSGAPAGVGAAALTEASAVPDDEELELAPKPSRKLGDREL